MELCSLQSPTVSCSSTPRNGFFVYNHHSFSNGQSVKLPNNQKYPDARKLKFVSFKAQASGTTRSSSLTVEAITQDIDSKDENLVFVAGATGKVGSRTVRELLKLGFKVRAGVRNVQRAETLVKSVEQLKLDEEIQCKRQIFGRTPAIKKLEIVECDLEKPDMIKPALGNASIVVCCIGASEKEILDVTGPCRIDYRATKRLIDAATAAKANHFILVTSLGTNKLGFPAAILNLFWGVLIWKRKAEEALLASGIPYTIVRPGGMERPTDSYKETHNVTLAVEDTLFGGQVSNLQVAELIAYMAKNRSLSYCKVVEVIAETTAPLTPFGELLEKIPSQRVEVYKPKEPVAAEVPKPSSPTQTEPTPSKEMATRPLSPFANYEDLKPPSSPCPTPSGPKGIANNVTEVEAVLVDKDPPPTTNYCHSPYPAYNDFKPPTSPLPSSPITKLVSTSPSTKAEAAIVVDKDTLPTTNYCHSPFPAYNDFKPPTSPSPIPPITKLMSTSPSTKAEAAIVVDKDPLPTTNYCHSPFPAYNDFKPPTSPLPSPPITKLVSTSPSTKAEAAVVVDKDPLPTTNYCHSPFPAYNDFKPPTSPLPSPPITKLVSTSPSTKAEAVIVVDKDPLPTTNYCHSPFPAYNDFKPPTSPSPSPPITKLVSTSPSNGAPQIADVSGNGAAQSPISAPQTRPLSPFAMYVDMKPPTSPSPSLPKK